MSNKAKKKGTGVTLWSILTVLFTVVFAAACVGSNLAFASEQAVNIALKTATHKTIGKDPDTVYFSSDFDSVEELEAYDQMIAEQLTGEGAVLLKNDNGALPLAPGQQGIRPEPLQRGHRHLRYRLRRYRHLQRPHPEGVAGGCRLHREPCAVGLLHPQQGHQPGGPGRPAHQ